MQGSFFWLLIAGGSWFVLWGVLLILWLSLDDLRELWYLGGVKKRLQNGATLDRGKNWARLTADYWRMDKFRKDYQELTLPISGDGFDFAAAYLNGAIQEPTILLRNGNKVLCAFFHQSSQMYTMPFDEWATALAASIS